MIRIARFEIPQLEHHIQYFFFLCNVHMETKINISLCNLNIY
jgi:hypothetical protein